MSARLLPVFVVLLACFVCFGTEAAAEGDPVSIETAEQELGLLKQELGSRKSINENINAALEAVSNAYHNLEAPLEPEPMEVPEDANEEARKVIESANRKSQDAYKKALSKFDRAKEKFQKDAMKLFLKALKLQKLARGGGDRNLRDDVNIMAAQVIGNTGDPDVSKALIKALEGTIFKAKYQVPMLMLEESFAALGRLGDIKSLEWMASEFLHTKDSPREQVERLMAAQKAMVMFPYEVVPGKLRHSIVNDIVKTYASVESQAEQNSADAVIQAKKRFWDDIKTYTIKVAQHFAGQPKNENEEVLARIAEFQDWFRDHKSPSRAPWKDPK